MSIYSLILVLESSILLNETGTNEAKWIMGFSLLSQLAWDWGVVLLFSCELLNCFNWWPLPPNPNKEDRDSVLSLSITIWHVRYGLLERWCNFGLHLYQLVFFHFHSVLFMLFLLCLMLNNELMLSLLLSFLWLQCLSENCLWNSRTHNYNYVEIII